jgi:2-methylcitrate dehydratase PrpD
LITQSLAKNIIRTVYSDLSTDAINVTKKSILDTLGVMFPPTTLDKSCISIYELMQEAGGNKESTYIGFGGRGPVWQAAFVNGSLTHALDYDDSVDAGPQPLIHPTGSTFPAAFAVAEKVRGVSGKDFITAVALGNDLGVRLAACVKGNVMHDYSFFPITVFGVFAAATAAGKLLKLTEAEMINALSLAAHRATGIKDVLMSPDSELRSIRDGFTNREGVFSALMASRGIAGGQNGLESVLKVYYRGEYDPAVVTDGLGKIFRGREATFKNWPACGQTHGFIQACLQLLEQHKIQPDKIREICLTGSQAAEALYLPLDKKQQPDTGIAAKFSLPFVVATALTKKEVNINSFLDQSLHDNVVLKIAKLVKFKVDPSFGSLLPAIVEVKTIDGDCYSCRVDSIKNQKSIASSATAQIAKFKDCIAHAKCRFSEGQVDKLIGALMNLENVHDIREISDLLA